MTAMENQLRWDPTRGPSKREDEMVLHVCAGRMHTPLFEGGKKRHVTKPESLVAPLEPQPYITQNVGRKELKRIRNWMDAYCPS